MKITATNNRGSCTHMVFKIGVLKNLTKFSGLISLWQACNFIKKEAPAQLFSCKYGGMLKNTFCTQNNSEGLTKYLKNACNIVFQFRLLVNRFTQNEPTIIYQRICIPESFVHGVTLSSCFFCSIQPLKNII